MPNLRSVVSFVRMICRATGLLGAVVAAFAETPTAAPDVLRYAFKKGQTFEVTYSDTSQQDSQDEHAVMSIGKERKKELSMGWEVMEVSENGDAVIKVHYAGLSTTLDLGSIVVKIDTAEEIVFSNPVLVAHKDEKGVKEVLAKLADLQAMLSEAIVGKEYTLTVSNRGRIVSVVGLDEVMDGLRAAFAKREPDLAARAQLDAVIEQFFGEDAVRQTLSDLLVPYPEAPVAKGLAWEEDLSVPWPPGGASARLSTHKKFLIEDASTFASDGTVTITGKVDFALADGKAPASAVIHPNACRYTAFVRHGMVDEIRYTSYLEIDRFQTDANGRQAPLGNVKLMTGYEVHFRIVNNPVAETAATKPPAPVQLPWDEIQVFAEGLAGVSHGGKWGFVDETGQVVIAPQWTEVSHFAGGLANVEQGGKWGFIDRTGKVVIPLTWDHAEPFSDERAQVDRATMTGYIDQTGKVIAEPQWGRADPYSDGMALVFDGKNFGYLDKTGRLAIAPQWPIAMAFVSGLAQVGREGKYGFIDHSGKVVVPLQWDGGDSWDTAIVFSEGLAWVRLDGKYSFIDRTGHVVGDEKWDKAEDFSEGLAPVWRGEKGGFIDRTGKIVVALEWTDTRPVTHGFGWVGRDGLYAPVGRDGKVIGEPQWAQIASFADERAAVGTEGKGWGYIDPTGTLAVEQQWNFADKFSEGRAAVGRGDSEPTAVWGFVDKTGTVVVEPKWNKVGLYSEGRVAVSMDSDTGDRWGFIDEDGKVISEPQWDKVRPFSHGFAVVQQNDKLGFIDKSGKIVGPPPEPVK